MKNLVLVNVFIFLFVGDAFGQKQELGLDMVRA